MRITTLVTAMTSPDGGSIAIEVALSRLSEADSNGCASDFKICNFVYETLLKRACDEALGANDLETLQSLVRGLRGAPGSIEVGLSIRPSPGWCQLQ